MLLAQRLRGFKRPVANISDPYWDDVHLLMDASEGIVDLSPKATPVTAIAGEGGGIDNTQVKFGSSSFVPRFLLGSSFSFGNGPFTVEAWVYLKDTSDGTILFTENNFYETSLFYFAIYQGRLAAIFMSGLNITDLYVDGTTTFPNHTWTFVTLQRDINQEIKIFLNGVSDATPQSHSMDFIDESGESYSGIRYKNRLDKSYGEFDGYLDQLRVTNAARYTSDFMPPNAPFPNTGP